MLQRLRSKQEDKIKQMKFVKILNRENYEIVDHEDYPVQIIKDLFLGSW